MDNGGKVTAIKNGTAIITVTVKKPKITVGQEQISLVTGETCQPNVMVSSGNKPEYYSSNTNVATVNETGMITANGKGRAYIYAKEDGTKVRMTVTVKEKQNYRKQNKIMVCMTDSLRIITKGTISERY